MNILLFGGTGMLGNYVYNILSEYYNVTCITRNEFDIEIDTWLSLKNKISTLLNKNDIIINCAGVIPQKSNNNEYLKYIRINSIFPHKLQELALLNSYKLIHISTDCVFDGLKGNYLETDDHSPDTFYGISKSLGEPELGCIIRTSIIGEELFEKKSLIEWVKKQSGKIINGYTNCFWNGVTCLTLANIIKNIIDNNLFWIGVKHIYSPDIISKNTLCNYINEIYNLNISIIKDESIKCNRTIMGTHEFKIENIKDQIIEQKNFKLIKKGSFTDLNSCRFCNNTNISEIIHFKDFPLAGGFLSNKSDTFLEKVYPLTFLFCNDCKTGLVKEIICSDSLFKTINSNGYFYYSSTINELVIHFNKLACKINTKYPYKKNILEIGCNDGVLLNSLYTYGYTLTGVDPSCTISNIKNTNINKYNTFFNNQLCENIIKKHGKQDIIISCNCLAHIDNIDDIYKNIKKLLSDDGVIIIEVHYLKNIIENMNFDFIYHEHMSYYSINTFLQICKKYNLYLEDLEFIETHGGSLRVFLTHRYNENLYNNKIQHFIDNEFNIQTDIVNIFKNIEIWKNKIINIINTIKSKDMLLIGYGASGRTNTILNYINIEFDYILDDSINKINGFLPYFHTSILDSNEIYTLNAKIIFILAWPYTKNIINKHIKFILNGGTFIKILPSIIEINKNNYLDYISY